jgi:hypothetical protein
MRLSLSNCTILAAAFHLSMADNSSSKPYEIAKSPNNPARAQAIEVKRQNFLYGLSPAGPVPFFPAGSLGNATVQKDVADDLGAFLAQAQAVALDQAAATASITQVCCLPLIY